MGTLYLVATPIGNLKDITLRALETFKEVDYLLCEDTRVTLKLLAHYALKVPLRSFHEHNEARRLPQIISDLKKGSKIALVSDAGTPLISDPGYKLVRECLSLDIKIVVVPGASSVTAALLASGLPPNKFLFLGFLPAKPNRREKKLATLHQQYTKDPLTIIFFESKHRLVSTLEMVNTIFGPQTSLAVIKELTKLHERVFRGTCGEILQEVKDQKNLKGEFTLVLGPAKTR